MFYHFAPYDRLLFNGSTISSTPDRTFYGSEFSSGTSSTTKPKGRARSLRQPRRLIIASELRDDNNFLELLEFCKSMGAIRIAQAQKSPLMLLIPFLEIFGI